MSILHPCNISAALSKLMLIYIRDGSCTFTPVQWRKQWIANRDNWVCVSAMPKTCCRSWLWKRERGKGMKRSVALWLFPHPYGRSSRTKRKACKAGTPFQDSTTRHWPENKDWEMSNERVRMRARNRKICMHAPKLHTMIMRCPRGVGHIFIFISFFLLLKLMRERICHTE